MAVGHFNINNLEWAKSILLTAQEMNAPVILGVSPKVPESIWAASKSLPIWLKLLQILWR